MKLDGAFNRKATEPVHAVSHHRTTAARSWINSLSIKKEVLGPDVSADAPWRMLLHCYVAYKEGERVTAAEVCAASDVAPSLANRYLVLLDNEGWLERADGDRANIDLTAKSIEAIEKLMDLAVNNSRRLGLIYALLDT